MNSPDFVQLKSARGILLLLGILLSGFASSETLAQTGSVVTVNADQVMVLNGRKVFPIGFSPGPPTGGKTPTGKDALQELREAGALLVRLAQTGDWNSQLISTQQATLDWAYTNGIFCWVNLRELSKFAAGDTSTEAGLRNLIGQFKNHPALGLWKNFDEAWWAEVPAADLQRGYDVIKQEDPHHPVVQTHAPRGTVPELQPYNVAADILALDIYPVGYPPGAHSLLANKEISLVGDWTLFLSQVAAGQKPYFMIEQIGWSGVVPPGKTLRFPSFEQARFMAYQAIINGARGLFFFGGNVAATLNPQDLALGWNWTYWDQVLKRVVLELGDNSPLRPALVVSNSTLPVALTVATNVEFCVREVPPYLYILACKREGPTIQVTFNGLPNWAGTGELLFESPRKVTAQNGQFTDWFAPFEVHAYRFLNPTSPPSDGLILHEPFDYANIGAPVSVNLPANWDSNGSGANDLNVTAGNLSYAGLATSVGNSVTNGGVGLGIRRLFGTSVNTGAVYFSALFRVNDLGYGAWNGLATQVGAFTAIDNMAFRLQVMIQSNSPSSYMIGVQKGGAGATTTFDATGHAAGETVFIVGKYDFGPSSDLVSLWVNPSTGTFGASTEPANGLISASNGLDGFTIDRFNFRQNTAASVPAAMQWDEFRVGTTWASVTPTAAAAGTVLTNVVQLGNGSFQFEYANSSAQSATIYTSTNLTTWLPLGAATPISPGRYQFTDPATNHSRRFYQLRTP